MYSTHSIFTFIDLTPQNRRLKQIVADQALDIRALKITLKKLLKPRVKRLAVSHARESLGLSETRACQLVDVSSSVYRYQPKPDNDEELRKRLRELLEFSEPKPYILISLRRIVYNICTLT